MWRLILCYWKLMSYTSPTESKLQKKDYILIVWVHKTLCKLVFFPEGKYSNIFFGLESKY